MTLDQIDEEFDRALKRIHLKIEATHILWLIKHLDLSKIEDYDNRIPYLPVLPEIDFRRERLKNHLNFLGDQGLHFGIQLDLSIPVTNLSAPC